MKKNKHKCFYCKIKVRKHPKFINGKLTCEECYFEEKSRITGKTYFDKVKARKERSELYFG